ncbi:general secretion pathway protein G [Halanaerobium saccharolyticum]|uniref:General secretion pathway protein G n=1 Tax=Halanaerobium saccharolyticum TaxID=43595 RepID=A0A4R6SBU7_9FIRM|nr:type II secretion system protein [Halanaerobium saccharolyticum]TDP96947.1 general secretion pathway protein G [Halanaerobium saccharolyticum]
MQKIRNLFKHEEGFTLIELLVVIAVLGILAAIAIPRLGGVTDKATRSEASSFLSSVKSGLEMYYVENDNSYPADGATLSDNAVLGQYISNFGEVTDDWSISYSYTDDDDFKVTMDHSDADISDVILQKSANGYVITP